MRLPTKPELLEFWKGRGPWLVVFALMAPWFVYPLWASRVLPLDDLPNHLARITALHHLSDPKWNLSPYFERSLGLVPYLGHFYTVHLLAYVFGSVTRANLVYMSAYVMAAPLCGLAFARATGRSPWLAFLLLPLSVSYFFQWSFISFCVGVMLMLPACALLYRTLDAPSVPRAVGLLLVTCALYLHHILPWGAFGLYALFVLLLELGARRWRPVVLAAAMMLPSVGLFGMGLREARSSGYLHAQQSYEAQKDTPAKVLSRSTALFDLWGTQASDEWLLIGLCVAVLLLALSDDGREPEPWRKRLRIPLALTVFVALGLATPFAVKKPFNWWMVNMRFFMLVAAVGAFLPRGRIAGGRAALLGLAIASSALLPYWLHQHYRAFSKKAEPVVRLMQEVPLGSNTLYLHTPPSALGPPRRDFGDPDAMIGMALWREFYNYPMVYRGGFDPYMYDDGFPVRRIGKLPYPKVESALVQVWSVDEARFKPEMLHGWDYFIVRDDNLDAMPPDGVVRVDHQGQWTLFRNLLKDQPTAP